MSDDIKLPPLPMALNSPLIAGHAQDYARVAVEADRQDHVRDAAKMMPSDAELEKAWDSFEAEMARQPTDDELEEFMAQFADEAGCIHDDQHAKAARALLSRYGSGQPKPSNSTELTQCRVPSDDDLLGCAGVTRHHDGGTPMIIGVTDIHRFADCVRKHYSSGQPATSAKPPELHGIANALAKGNGFWRSCSGCHELNEGHDTGPYSETLKCHLGNGCSECGGIGAIWDTTDYGAMGDFLMHDTAAPVAQEPVANDIEDLIERVLDAQQDINLEANMHMSQSLCDAAALLDEVETALRRLAAPVAAQAQPLTTGQILSLERRSSMSDDEAIRFARSVQSALSCQPSVQDREDAPSISNPLTPYGLLVQALRLVSGTTLMELSEGTGYTPSYLSSVEFGREVPTDALIGTTQGFFCDKGIDVPLSLLQVARAAKGE